MSTPYQNNTSVLVSLLTPLYPSAKYSPEHLHSAGETVRLLAAHCHDKWLGIVSTSYHNFFLHSSLEKFAISKLCQYSNSS